MFKFDEKKLAEATTLPSFVYLSAEVLEQEQKNIFEKTWQWVGAGSQIPNVGDYFTVEVAEQPLVIVRSEDLKVRAFYNVCQHRAGRVASGCGNRKSLQCQYHAWTYNLRGELLRTPEFDGVKGFCKQDFSLVEVCIEEWGQFLFVNLSSSTEPLFSFLEEVVPETKSIPIRDMVLYKSHDYHIRCNWKVYVDNYLEGYHIPMAHPGLFKEIDYKEYKVETRRYHSKQHAPVRKENSLYTRSLATGETPQALYYWVFPNLMLNIYPDHIQVNMILPKNEKETIVRFLWYWLNPDDSTEEKFKESFQFSDLVQQEDIELCESVQKGLASNAYDQGRYSVLRENGVYHFHCLYQYFQTCSTTLTNKQDSE